MGKRSCERRGGAILAVLALTLVVALPGSAVIIDSGDGTGNDEANLLDDPGWAHVGTRGALSAIYLGDGWVLTANHVGISAVVLEGVTHQPVLPSQVQVEHAPGSMADLRLFRLVSDPGLPTLPLASSAPSVGDEIVMIGHGRDRGPFAVVNPPGLAYYTGWEWAASFDMRWGTNRISSLPGNQVSDGAGGLTRTIAAAFSDDFETPHEAIAAVGDSGGAVFRDSGVQWELIGLMWATTVFPGQPTDPAGTRYALYGNETWIADLYYYGAKIASITTDPTKSACSDGNDDDGDTLTDWPADPGCSSADDPFETNAAVVCDNGFDDDDDGHADWPADPGCLDATWPNENPACDNGLDDDGDGEIDWGGGPGGEPADSHCVGQPYRNNEAPQTACGLGFELVALLALLRARRRLC